MKDKFHTANVDEPIEDEEFGYENETFDDIGETHG